MWSQSGLDFSINVAVVRVAKGADQWGCEHCKTLPLIDRLIINDVLWLCDGVCSESREALPNFQKRQVIGKKSRKGLERCGVGLESRQEFDLPAKSVEARREDILPVNSEDFAVYVSPGNKKSDAPGKVLRKRGMELCFDESATSTWMKTQIRVKNKRPVRLEWR